MIKKGIEKPERFHQLREIAEYQLKILNEKNTLKAIKKLSDNIYLNHQKRIDE